MNSPSHTNNVVTRMLNEAASTTTPFDRNDNVELRVSARQATNLLRILRPQDHPGMLQGSEVTANVTICVDLSRVDGLTLEIGALQPPPPPPAPRPAVDRDVRVGVDGTLRCADRPVFGHPDTLTGPAAREAATPLPPSKASARTPVAATQTDPPARAPAPEESVIFVKERRKRRKVRSARQPKGTNNDNLTNKNRANNFKNTARRNQAKRWSRNMTDEHRSVAQYVPPDSGYTDPNWNRRERGRGLQIHNEQRQRGRDHDRDNERDNLANSSQFWTPVNPPEGNVYGDYGNTNDRGGRDSGSSSYLEISYYNPPQPTATTTQRGRKRKHASKDNDDYNNRGRSLAPSPAPSDSLSQGPRVRGSSDPSSSHHDPRIDSNPGLGERWIRSRVDEAFSEADGRYPHSNDGSYDLELDAAPKTTDPTELLRLDRSRDARWQREIRHMEEHAENCADCKRVKMWVDGVPVGSQVGRGGGVMSGSRWRRN